MEQFLQKYFRDHPFKVFPLAGDASARKYFRIVSQEKTWVLMSWEPFDPNKYPFLSVLNHFARNHVHVPEVVSQDPSQGLILLEDLGDLTLERKFWESQNQSHSKSFYEKSIDELIKMHFNATLDKSPCTAFDIQFDTEKFMWEMNYGLDNLIVQMNQQNLSDSRRVSVVNVFKDICETLHQEPKFIAHRDYHSRNLMIKFDEIRVIDFQDARLGPIQYDLVSLFRDSYVNMSEQLEHELTEDYLYKAKKFLPKDFSREHFNEIYEKQTIQRCFKACGSFSSFYNQRKDTRYLKYISHTLRRVLKSLNAFPKYKPFSDLLIDSGALERKYESAT